MKPGATMSPVASMTRAASPLESMAHGGDAVALDGDVRGRRRRAAAVDDGAVLDEERPGHDSTPCPALQRRLDDLHRLHLVALLILSTTSMPDVTLPNTVYWPSRCGVRRA